MKIYTSYFAKAKKIPSEIIPVSIALKAPPGYTGLSYKKLSPNWDILSEWKRIHNEEIYCERFSREILSKLTPEGVLHELETLSGGKDVVLLCYEKTGSFCHRNEVAKWMTSAGIEVKEF